MDIAALTEAAGKRWNVDPALLRAQIQVESGGNPQADSGQAYGISQFTPATAQAMGVDPKDPASSIDGQARLMAQNLDRYGSTQLALMAYHGGTDQSNWGPKTQAYPGKVLAHYQQGGSMPQQMPGMPPSAPDAPVVPGGTIDPFTGLQAPQQAQTTPQGPTVVDPFAGLNGSGGSGRWTINPGTPVGPAPTFSGSVGQGMRDGVNAAEQTSVHSVQAMPSNVASVVNQIPLIGPVTKMLGMIPAQQMDQRIAQQEQQYAASRAASGQTGIDWGRGVGNALVTAPLALAAPETAGMSLLAKTGVGMGLGAANAAFSPVTNVNYQPDGSNDFSSQKGWQTGLSALVGGAATPVTSAIGSAISGAGDAAVRRLQQAGVTMTPGQILGGGWKAVEDKLTSVPVLGDFIQNAQRRAVQGFNKATYNEVLAPLGKTFEGDVGTEGVAAVKKTISDAYDSALSKMTFNAQDPGLKADLANVAQMVQSLPPAQQAQFKNIIQTQISGKLSPQGTMTGETLKGVQSELGNASRGYAGDASFDNQNLGHAIAAVKDAIDNSLPRYNPPEAAEGLKAANAAYANYVRLRGAAASTGAMNNGGVFTAAQLNSAVRGTDQSVGKDAVATGKALMQDFSTDAQSVLGNKYPDSGTVGRSLLATAGTIGGAALGGHAFLPDHLILPAIATAAGTASLGALGSLPYTSMGQKLAQALLMGGRNDTTRAVGQAVSRYGTSLAPALGAALLQSANR